MPDSVSSDAVDSVRATLARAGRTDRPKVTLPDDARDRFPAETVVRLVLDGSTRHARVERALDDTLEFRGAYANARQARNSAARSAAERPSEEQRDSRGEVGENHLLGWADDHGLDFGRTVHVDVVAEGEVYGLRAPGERAVYTVSESTDSRLADIAEEVEENR